MCSSRCRPSSAAPRDRRVLACGRAARRRCRRRAARARSRATARPPPDESRATRLGADRDRKRTQDRRPSALARGDAHGMDALSLCAQRIHRQPPSHDLRHTDSRRGRLSRAADEGGLDRGERSEFLTRWRAGAALTKLATDMLDLLAARARRTHDSPTRSSRHERAGADSHARCRTWRGGGRCPRVTFGGPPPALGDEGRVCRYCAARRQRVAAHAGGLDRHAQHRDAALGARASSSHDGPGISAGALERVLSALPRSRRRPARAPARLAIARELDEGWPGDCWRRARRGNAFTTRAPRTRWPRHYHCDPGTTRAIRAGAVIAPRRGSRRRCAGDGAAGRRRRARRHDDDVRDAGTAAFDPVSL